MLIGEKNTFSERTAANIKRYLNNPVKYKKLFIDIEPYLNPSCIALKEEFSLNQAYVIFRSLGLRHIVVINMNNEVTGIITRKDLMGFRLEENLITKRRISLYSSKRI